MWLPFACLSALHSYCLSPNDAPVICGHCCSMPLLLVQARRDVMPSGRVGYSRSCLLTLYWTTAPSYSVHQRLHELDLLAVCRLSCHHLSSTVCLRCYRGCRAGRSRRSVPRLKLVGNGAYIVTVPRPSTRLCPTSRRHCCRFATLIDVRTISPPIASTGRLITFSFLNVCSLTKSMICSSCDVIAISMSCASPKRGTTPILSLFDVCALPATKWSIIHARDHRPNCRQCRPTMAKWQLCPCPAFRVLSIALGVDSTSFELLCARVVSDPFSAIVILIYRPG